MNLNVEVGDEIEAVLKARAQAQGVTPERIASQVLKDVSPAKSINLPNPPRQCFSSGKKFWTT